MSREETIAMRYTLLGHSGLRVSEVALGTITFGTDWGWGASQSESAKQFELFAEAGGIALSGGFGLARRLQQLDGAQNFFFQRLEIGCGMGRRCFNTRAPSEAALFTIIYC